MKVTVCFDNVKVVVPCGDGSLLVRDLMYEAILRYKKATGKNDSSLTISSLSSLTGGGIFDPDDRLHDVADDREQIVATFVSSDVIHIGGDGASSVGTNSPDLFQGENKDLHRYAVNMPHTQSNSKIKRESAKRLSMHVLSTREPCVTTYSAMSLPRESRRKEPLGQDAKSSHEFSNSVQSFPEQSDIHDIVIKNDAGPLGLHVVPCYDLLGNDQGLRVEGIEPNGRIAKDGQIDLHDKIIKINGHTLLHIPFSKVQEIFRTCMSEPCLQISVLKHKKSKETLMSNNAGNSHNAKKVEIEDNTKKLQPSSFNLLQTSNTRKIGRMIDIELIKGNNGLGFSVTTRDNPAGGHCPIYIKNILPKGAAVEDGRLKPGDRLLEVNKFEMTGKSQAEVVSLLRSIPPGGKVQLLVSRQEEVGTNSEPQIGVPIVVQDLSRSNKSWKSYQPMSSKNVGQSHSSETLDLPVYDKCNVTITQALNNVVLSPRKNRMILTLDIPVHDSEKAGLGVSVKGKTSTSDDTSSVDLGIFIKSVLNGGAASRDGRLKTNDQLLNVNGVSLLGLSNSDAMETLRRAMLSTNSSLTGVITLTIARRVSSYDTMEQNFMDKISSECKLELANSIIITDSTKQNDGRVKEKNNLNSQADILDNDCPLPTLSASPWNPVIDRITEQYNQGNLRNESYNIAMNKTWIDSVNNVQKLTLGDHQVEPALLEDLTDCRNDTKRKIDDKESQYSEDPTYDSQLSLEEVNSGKNKFSRDALGRQSMSEKRHAALDAKNTDTYKRNKKLREGRENKSGEKSNEVEDFKDQEKRKPQVENSEKVESKSVGGSASFDINRKRFDKKLDMHSQSQYLYTIPGCNNKPVPPKKHWIDDIHDKELQNNNRGKDEGFPNSRGDVKQASLNSALDDRYKRSRKKSGIRSMLRLGKNRKSLNFGDNIEPPHESSNYCSGTINYIA